MKNYKRICLFLISIAVLSPYLTITTALTAAALEESKKDKWASNNIMFYDPDECTDSGNTASGGNIVISAEDLPAEAISILESAGVKDKAEQNYDAYKAGADDAGIPWQALAALHYREAGMNPSKSISDGESLGSGNSVDGVELGETLEESAVIAANHLASMASMVYSLDIATMDNTLDNWGQAFLAYNRGFIYSEQNAPWDSSPYAANYMDSSHIAMDWPSYEKDGSYNTGLAGQKDANVGAITVYIYLGGMTGSSGSSQSSTSSSNGGEDVTWIGDSISASAESSKLFDEKLSKADKYVKSKKQFGEADESSEGGKGGLSIIKELKSSNKLKNTIVYALGTDNPGLTQDDINAVLDEIETKKIVFVTNYDKDGEDTYASNNNAYSEAEKNNDNVIIADWKATAEKSPDDYFDTGDSVHPNEKGLDKWMELVESKLNLNASNTSDKNNDNCACPTTTAKSSGQYNSLTDEQADKIVAYFKDSDNDSKWTPSIRKWNCVSLSTFFVQMFTSIGGAPAATGGAVKECIGCSNGREVVSELEALGVESGNEPRPFAVFSVNGPCNEDGIDATAQGNYSTTASGCDGHTGVITSVDGDNVTFIEARWSGPSNNYKWEGYADKVTKPKSDMVNLFHTNKYAYLDSYIDADALAEALGEKINTASTNGSGGVTQSSVTWDNGWISSGLDGYYKDDGVLTNDSAHTGSFKTTRPKDGAVGPNKILLHNTEGTIGSSDKGSDIFNALYNPNFDPDTSPNGSFPPHFTIDLKTKRVFQHYPITAPSDSVAEHDDTAGVQIEIVGYSTSASSSSDWYLYNDSNFGNAEWSYLATLLSAISNETGISLTTDVDWTSENKLSTEDFKDYSGIIGHMHTPDNDHSDPGNIWPKLSNALGNQTVSTGDCPGASTNKSYTGDFPFYDQFDSQWASVPYGACGTIKSSGCGPTSFAMMATALTGTEYLPDEVATYAGNAGMHICKNDCTCSGSSWSLPETIGDHFGLQVTDLGDPGVDTISEYLRNGYMIWTCGSGSSPYTKGGHCIGIRGITDDGEWLIADSNGTYGQENTKNKSFSPSTIYSSGNPYKALKAK